MSGKFTKATEEAKKYAEKHDLERLIAQMVNTLVITKPEEPTAHMLRYLLEKCDLDQQSRAPVKIVKDVPEKKVNQMPEDRSRTMYDKLNMQGGGTLNPNQASTTIKAPTPPS
eukprot:TRINITY_DN49134_c0_g1_i1.p1 TRINITY_DN49134_c0_g1~~TRINITY_DN49134_c0_g1_i1.p1  ORF type:complete len:113 (+),score=29.72 TRINITY_DN49134_c0_g1_i1:91-429(+)